MTRARAGTASLAFGLALALAALVAGCGGVKGTLVPNLPPETVVFVSGPVDTLNHVVHLRWFGSDPDGRVARYEFRWVYPTGQSPAGYDSSLWIPTLRTDSTFTLYTPAGYSMPTFVVRAVDDQGEPDPTPARETFQFTNQPPTVRLTNLPLPTTFPVVTISWTASDPDGDISRASYLVWLDANEAGATLVPASHQYTLPPATFSDGAGGYVGGPHTVHIRAVDDGGAVSAPDSARWTVQLPQGQVLLVDDHPGTTTFDDAYTHALNNQLGGASAYTVINFEVNDPFRSPDDVRYTFGFFHSILWYQENNLARSAALALAEPGIRAALAAGHNFYVCSTALVGTNGAITTPSFLTDVVGADSMRVNVHVVGSDGLPTTNFSISSGAILRPGPATPYDSLKAVGIASNVDALVLADPTQAAFLAPPIELDSLQTEDWVVGVDRVPPGGTGRFVYLAFPLRFLGGNAGGVNPPPPDANWAERTLRNVLYRFGHGSAP